VNRSIAGPPTEFDRCPAGDDRHPQIGRVRLDHLPHGRPEVVEAAAGGHRRRHDVGEHRHHGQILLGPQEVQRNGEAVVEQEVVAVGEVDPSSEALLQQVPGDVAFEGGVVGGDAEQVLLVRERAARPFRLADEKRRHVVVEPLVEVVAGHDDEHVRACRVEAGAQLGELADRALERLRGRGPLGRDAGQCGVVRDAQHLDDGSHRRTSPRSGPARPAGRRPLRDRPSSSWRGRHIRNGRFGMPDMRCCE
jgi:hypothetical protein